MDRSELVSSALGEVSITADASPVCGEARLWHIPAAIPTPNASPPIALSRANCAIAKEAATEVSSLMVIVPSIPGPITVNSVTPVCT
jgi:hypothetical protein